MCRRADEDHPLKRGGKVWKNEKRGHHFAASGQVNEEEPPADRACTLRHCLPPTPGVFV